MDGLAVVEVEDFQGFSLEKGEAVVFQQGITGGARGEGEGFGGQDFGWFELIGTVGGLVGERLVLYSGTTTLE